MLCLGCLLIGRPCEIFGMIAVAAAGSCITVVALLAASFCHNVPALIGTQGMHTQFNVLLGSDSEVIRFIARIWRSMSLHSRDSM